MADDPTTDDRVRRHGALAIVNQLAEAARPFVKHSAVIGTPPDGLALQHAVHLVAQVLLGDEYPHLTGRILESPHGE